MTDDPKAWMAGFVVIFMSIMGGMIVSVIPDPVNTLADSPQFRDDPNVQKVNDRYNNANNIETKANWGKGIGQITLFFAVPFATLYGLIKAE